MMSRDQRLAILKEMQSRGYTLAGWCRANGFPLRTAQDFFHLGTGIKHGGKKTREIVAALVRHGFLSSEKRVFGHLDSAA